MCVYNAPLKTRNDGTIHSGIRLLKSEYAVTMISEGFINPHLVVLEAVGAAGRQGVHAAQSGPRTVQRTVAAQVWAAVPAQRSLLCDRSFMNQLTQEQNDANEQDGVKKYTCVTHAGLGGVSLGLVCSQSEDLLL